MDVALTDLEPVDELDAELECGLSPPHEIEFVDSQDLVEDAIEGRGIVTPAPLYPRSGFLGGKREVLVQHRQHRGLWPIGIGTAQESCQVVGVSVPASVGIGDLCLVSSFGCRHQIHCNQDVLFQQVGELGSSGSSVVRYDGVSNVLLVPKQPVSCCLRAGVASYGRYDIKSRPDDMIGPQFSHCVMQLG